MGRVIAVDPGTVRVGLAVSDPTRVLATPAGNLAAEPAATLVARLAAAVREREAEEIVVGLPRRMDGSEGPEARAARRLAGELRTATGLRVHLVDERLSSVAAERALLAAGERRARRRVLSDPVAAAIVLQSFLDGGRGRG